MERRHVFDTVAELYDAMRPTYPDALVETIVARLPDNPHILEIGCGPGKATRAYVDRGLFVRCIEPGANLAAIARRNLGDGIEVIETEFESWEAKPDAFDLVFCAQAWRHLDRDVRYRKAAAALKPAGTLAVYGNIAVTNFEEGQEVYRRWWPGYRGESLPPVEERIERTRAAFEASGWFADIEVHRYPWTGRYTADEYVALLNTYSDHQLLPPETKPPFFDAMRDCIERLGGTCTREYEAVLHIAKPVKG